MATASNTKKSKSKPKSGVDKIGKKAKKVAKTDMGRAGIGAGIGALALGPIGAAAGAGIAMATKENKKNPATLSSIESEIKRGRVKRSVSRYAKISKASEYAAKESSKERLSKINPGQYNVKDMTDDELSEELDAADILIKKSNRNADSKMIKSLTSVKGKISRELKRRENPGINIGSDKTFAKYGKEYINTRRSYLNLIASPGSSESAISKAKSRFDEAEKKLILYAEVTKMKPLELQKAIERFSNKNRATSKNPCLPCAAALMANPYLGDAVSLSKAKKADVGKAAKRKGPPPPPPKKKNPKSGWKIEVDKCRDAWESYCDKPNKKNLKSVFDKLKEVRDSEHYSNSKRVKSEYKACMHAAKKEHSIIN